MHTHKARNAAETCDVVFANSRFTADDLSTSLGIAEDRIVVAQPGVYPGLSPEGPRADLGAPSVLGLGTIEPRKNIARLVEAWKLLDGELGLVLAGGEGWGDGPDLADPRIRRLGYVPDGEIARLYRGAAVLVYPSLFEGFGIPVIEAMACGTPVVATEHPFPRRGLRPGCGAGRPPGRRVDRSRHPGGRGAAGRARSPRPGPDALLVGRNGRTILAALEERA